MFRERPETENYSNAKSFCFRSFATMVRNRSLFFVIFCAIFAISYSMSLPSDHGNEKKTPETKESAPALGLPLLEFKNGGIRVNFGGYHAEAGLGGLFGGTGSRGGLFAGAGTPFGAHASANLGGIVDGEDGGSSGGGLHARAGLGNSGPEAAAGLGGNLDGSNRNANGGRIYAATSNAGKTKIISKEIGSNIQAIPKKDMNGKATNVNSRSDVTRREVAISDEKINVIDPSITVPVTEIQQQYAYPTRRCRRKRLCNNIRKNLISHQEISGSGTPADLAFDKDIPNAGFDGPILGEKLHDIATPGFSGNSGIAGEIIAERTSYDEVKLAPGSATVSAFPPSRPKTTIFDDIFNIPIATLSAVNQLLNSKVG